MSSIYLLYNAFWLYSGKTVTGTLISIEEVQETRHQVMGSTYETYYNFEFRFVDQTGIQRRGIYQSILNHSHLKKGYTYKMLYSPLNPMTLELATISTSIRPIFVFFGIGILLTCWLLLERRKVKS